MVGVGCKMIYSTYLSNIPNVPSSATLIRVALPSILGPSRELLHDWKDQLITWDEYETQFRDKINQDTEAIAYLHKIKQMGETKDVVIYCYENLAKPGSHCHRTILMEMLKNIGAKVGGEYR